MNQIQSEGIQLTELERQLISAFRSMSTEARTCFIGMGESIARGSGAAEAPRLTLIHSRAAGAQHQPPLSKRT